MPGQLARTARGNLRHMRLLRSLLSGLGTLTMDPSSTLRRARIEMVRRDDAQQQAWSKSLDNAYREQQPRAGSSR